MTTESYNMPRAIGYRRISKDRGDNGLGLVAQQKAIRDEAERLGLTLTETFTDNGVSGGARIEKRVELLAALKELRPGDRLIVARRDRIARDVMLAGWIRKEVRKRGAEIVSAAGEGNGAADDPTAKLMQTIVDAFAEYERDLIRARTKAALATKKAAGRRWCKDAPYGYRWTTDGAVAENAAEQRTIKLVHELRGQQFTYRGIVGELQRRRRRNRAGRPFILPQVQRILTAERRS